MKLKTFFFIALLSVTILTFSSRSNAQAPLFFDGFLLDNAGQPSENFNLFFLWNVTDGSVDLVGGNIPGADEVSLGGRFVDLGGSTNDPGAFATRNPQVFSPGVTYNLSFLYTSSDRNLNQANITIGSKEFLVTASSGSRLTFRTFSQNFSFDELTLAPIVFQDLGNDNSGIGIDRVILTQVVAASEKDGQ